MANIVHIPIMAKEAVGMLKVIRSEPVNPQMKPSREAKTFGALPVIFGVAPQVLMIKEAKIQSML